MNKLFNKEMFKFIEDDNLNWEKTILLGSELLVKRGFATNELSSKIIESTIKHGPYYVLAPEIALAHAEPGPWCLKPGISFSFLSKPVKFSEDEKHKVKLLFTLSAPDSNSHLELLQEFVKYLGDKNFAAKLKECKNSTEIWSLISEVENGNH